MNNLLRKIDLTSLRLFVAVCQEKNIARAAEREFIAPSAVSRRIGEIEAMIGLPVIHRESRGISVTPVGETVLRHALAVIASIEALGAELSEFSSGAKGKVRLVGNLSSIVQFLPEDIAAFQRIFPHVDIDLEEQNSTEVMRSIREHNADLGICNAIAGLEQFQYLPYRTDHLFLMVPRSHPLSAETSVGLTEIVNENFVSLGADATLTQLLAQEAINLGAQLKIKIRVSSLDALCRMVHVGLGIAVVPQQIGELYLNTLAVKLVPIRDPWAIRHLVIIFNQRDQLTATATSLVNFLVNK
ncbi:LysR family transcriptional regulator [Glaciimonas sp. CA11.2]|nr:MULTISPECIES: LysR family transcriptional regulator [unclassified Glaciimonas]MEB0011748.1 LysR family transcriptional regulator [Glaciimonas sp. Cout2]MEB0080696.1 LysR family transcriptional regulator [Glaciimonas sp. Gout2]MEB0162178.1 LysR family transcriptional regulator [Glaciimonas sp. CA11.2]